MPGNLRSFDSKDPKLGSSVTGTLTLPSPRWGKGSVQARSRRRSFGFAQDRVHRSSKGRLGSRKIPLWGIRGGKCDPSPCPLPAGERVLSKHDHRHLACKERMLALSHPVRGLELGEAWCRRCSFGFAQDRVRRRQGRHGSSKIPLWGIRFEVGMNKKRLRRNML